MRTKEEAILIGRKLYDKYQRTYEADLHSMQLTAFMQKYSILYRAIHGLPGIGAKIIRYDEVGGDKECLRCGGLSCDDDFVGYCPPCLAALGRTKQQWRDLQRNASAALARESENKKERKHVQNH